LSKRVDPPPCCETRRKDGQKELLLFEQIVRLGVAGSEKPTQQVWQEDNKQELLVVKRRVEIAASGLVGPYVNIKEYCPEEH